MADRPAVDGNQPERLDATGPRAVVFCHQCENEWFQDDAGLITPESDPRPQRTRTPPPVPGNHPGRWGGPDNDSDPEEADIEEHITHGPGGSVLFQRTVRTSAPRDIPGAGINRYDERNPDFIMRDFEHMIGNLMGPQFQPGRPGRSGAHTLFPQGGAFGGQTVRVTHGVTPIVGHHITFGGPGARLAADIPGHQPARDGGPPPVPDLATYDPLFFHPNAYSRAYEMRIFHRLNPQTMNEIRIRMSPDQYDRIIGSLFGAPTAQAGQPHPPAQGLPAGLQGLFAAMANPANARTGDAVYTQEALDQIISTLMEQNVSSNAPGPASPDAISALPKKKLDEKELGPEGKAECSVCMDDVVTGVEVVVLPCSHWFHESCATAWLSEHNTCPICRKGIDSEQTRPANSRWSSQGSQSTRNEHRARRISSLRPRMERFTSASGGGATARNEARLESIRNNAGLPPPSQSEERHQNGGVNEFSRWRNASGSGTGSDEYNPPVPGSFFRRQSEMGEHQHEGRRTNTGGSDRSRESRWSSQSGSGNAGGGPIGWLRDRFGSGSGQGSGSGAPNRRSE
ncbi:related to zinc finger protein 364 [Rhynchosporium secalis]|uniref:RING-type E3 ubiquitin transferase n=1 Tax=Rhynchosporium secalis TaxID=38038 RepID=A0A1E1M4K5_RHYSE|nr:related to zinc finger protein 364 [Rhynchosporium secalis]